MAPKTVFVFGCCCNPVFTFFEEKLLSWPFLGQLTDISSISLKRTFLLFRCFAVFSFFALHRGFGVFAGNHDDRNFISLQRMFLWFCC